MCENCGWSLLGGYLTLPWEDGDNTFMLNHTEDIDDRNFYVEEFDTLDGTHWEIAVDIEKQIQEYLDKETADSD